MVIVEGPRTKEMRARGDEHSGQQASGVAWAMP
jgi:hypothetical protein